MNPLLIFKGLDLARIGLWALTIVCVVGTIWFHGYFKGSAKLDKYKSEQAQEATRIAQARSKVTERVVTRYLEKKGATERITETIEKEVIKYEQAKLDTCPLSVGAVSLHDAAAGNKLPDPAKSTDGTATDFKTADLTKTATENYSVCYQAIDRLKALQDWLRAQGQVR